MFAAWRNWRDKRRVKKMGYTEAEWEAAVADWPVLQRYQGEVRARLRDLSFRFLARKSIAPGSGSVITDAMCLRIATMALSLIHI